MRVQFNSSRRRISSCGLPDTHPSLQKLQLQRRQSSGKMTRPSLTAHYRRLCYEKFQRRLHEESSVSSDNHGTEQSSSAALATREHSQHSRSGEAPDLKEGNARIITSPEIEGSVDGHTPLARPTDAELHPNPSDEGRITDEGIWIPKGHDSRHSAGYWTLSTYPARPEEEISPFDDRDKRLYADDNALRKALADAEKAGRIYRILAPAHSDATHMQSATHAGSKHSLKRPATAPPDVGRSAAQRALDGKRLRQDTSITPAQENPMNKDHSFRIARETVSKIRAASGLTKNERALFRYIELLEDEKAALHKAVSQSNAALLNAQKELQAEYRATKTGMEDAILAAKFALRNLEDTALFLQANNPESILSRATVTAEDSLTEAGYLEAASNFASLRQNHEPKNEWPELHATHPDGVLAGLEEFTKEQLREAESDERSMQLCTPSTSLYSRTWRRAQPASSFHNSERKIGQRQGPGVQADQRRVLIQLRS